MYKSFFSAAMFGSFLLKKQERPEFFRNILPAVASQSMPPGPQGTFQAVTVTQQIKRAKVREEQVASDVVAAVSTVSARPAGPDKQLTAADINNLPGLSRVAKPDLVNRINAVVIAADQRAAVGGLQAARETISAFEKSAAKPFGSDKKLTEAEIKELPAFAAVLQQSSELHDRIAAVAVAADAQTQSTETETESFMASHLTALIGILYSRNGITKPDDKLKDTDFPADSVELQKLKAILIREKVYSDITGTVLTPASP